VSTANYQLLGKSNARRLWQVILFCLLTSVLAGFTLGVPAKASDLDFPNAANTVVVDVGNVKISTSGTWTCRWGQYNSIRVETGDPNVLAVTLALQKVSDGSPAGMAELLFPVLKFPYVRSIYVGYGVPCNEAVQLYVGVTQVAGSGASAVSRPFVMREAFRGAYPRLPESWLCEELPPTDLRFGFCTVFLQATAKQAKKPKRVGPAALQEVNRQIAEFITPLGLRTSTPKIVKFERNAKKGIDIEIRLEVQRRQLVLR